MFQFARSLLKTGPRLRAGLQANPKRFISLTDHIKHVDDVETVSRLEIDRGGTIHLKLKHRKIERDFLRSVAAITTPVPDFDVLKAEDYNKVNPNRTSNLMASVYSDIGGEFRKFIRLNPYVWDTLTDDHFFGEVSLWDKHKDIINKQFRFRPHETLFPRHKPWNQTNSGKARLRNFGSSKYHMGGKAHGWRPKDRSFRLPLNLVMRAMSSVLTRKYRFGDIKFVEQVSDVNLDSLDPENTYLLVDTNYDSHLSHKAKTHNVNIRHQSCFRTSVSHLLRNKHIFMTVRALSCYEQLLGMRAVPLTSKNYEKLKLKYQILAKLFSRVIANRVNVTPREVVWLSDDKCKKNTMYRPNKGFKQRFLRKYRENRLNEILLWYNIHQKRFNNKPLLRQFKKDSIYVHYFSKLRSMYG